VTGHVVPHPRGTEEIRWELGTSISLWETSQAEQGGGFGVLVSVDFDKHLLRGFCGSLSWT